MSEWVWATAGPRERADMVRKHRYSASRDTMLDLFELTDHGLTMILKGDNWRQEYERPSVNAI